MISDLGRISKPEVEMLSGSTVSSLEETVNRLEQKVGLALSG